MRAGVDVGRFEAPLPVAPELEPFVDRPGSALVEHLVRGLDDGTFRWAHRTVVLNAIARMPADGLATAVEALAAPPPATASGGQVAMWRSCSASSPRRRRAMLDELGVGASA